MNTQINKDSKDKYKIDQKAVESRTNDDFPAEFEEKRDDNSRMVPQPLFENEDDNEDEK